MEKIKHKKSSIVFAVIGGVLAVILSALFVYVSIFYHADDHAKAIASTDSDNYTVETDKNGYIVFKPTEAATTGLVFYPGGKVEYTAYAPLMSSFARRGVLCVLVKMPFDLAVFDINAADGVRDGYEQVEKWYIGGHSLGGSMAARYAATHVGVFDGLLLLGAYSADDLSSSGMNVISIYGSEDGVLNRQKYGECKKNLPTDYSELVIQGGCHSYFGDYGNQSGDGTPSVSREEQQIATAEFFREKA